MKTAVLLYRYRHFWHLPMFIVYNHDYYTFTQCTNFSHLVCKTKYIVVFYMVYVVYYCWCLFPNTNF